MTNNNRWIRKYNSTYFHSITDISNHHCIISLTPIHNYICQPFNYNLLTSRAPGRAHGDMACKNILPHLFPKICFWEWPNLEWLGENWPVNQKLEFVCSHLMTYYLYSGNFLYSSNSSSHSCSVLGGFIPFSKFHCVIDRPDSVNLQQQYTLYTTVIHIGQLCLQLIKWLTDLFWTEIDGKSLLSESH